MTLTTPKYALPYPQETDTADVPRDVQALAQRLEAVLPGVGMPTGAGMDWFAATAPTGFLLCDGSAVSRGTFAALFAVVGTTWGGGDGINTFNLPDTRGRVTVGVAPGGQAQVATLGANEGLPVGTRQVQHQHRHGLTLPDHAHAIGDPGHHHALDTRGFSDANPGDVGAGGQHVSALGPNVVAGGGIGNHDHGMFNATTGIWVSGITSSPLIPGAIGAGGAAVNDTPSFVVVSKVVKT
jgi:microcystin-dependent protein